MIPEATAERTVTETLFGRRPHSGPALVEAGSGRSLTYAQLAEAVWTTAAGLTGAGHGPGSVLALHLPDVPEFATVLHGALAAGVAVTPVRPATTAAAMARQLTETGAAVVVTWPVLLDIALEAAAAAGVGEVYCFGGEPDALPFADLLAGPPGRRPRRPDPATDLALLPYTRGTGTAPRGVRLTHRNLLAGFLPFAETGLIGPADTVLSGLPLSDVIGLSGVLHPALRAGAVVVSRPASSHRDLLRTLQEHQVTVAVLTPDQVALLATDPAADTYHLRSLRSVISTGAVLGADVARACAQRMRCPVRQAYGLTEAAGLTHVNLRAVQEGTLDSAGRALPPVEWRIADPADGSEQEPYQPGEVRLRGPMVTAGYVGGPAGAGEWLATGDEAFADEHGRLYVMGRMGERGGEPPAEPHSVPADSPAPTVHPPRDTRRMDSARLVEALPRPSAGRPTRRAPIGPARLPSLEG